MEWFLERFRLDNYPQRPYICIYRIFTKCSTRVMSSENGNHAIFWKTSESSTNQFWATWATHNAISCWNNPTLLYVFNESMDSMNYCTIEATGQWRVFSRHRYQPPAAWTHASQLCNYHQPSRCLVPLLTTRVHVFTRTLLLARNKRNCD